MPILAPNRFPNLQGMMDLFRSSINDDGGGQDGPQGGIIATNDAPFTLPFLNEAIGWVYRKLRNIGDPALILDNYLVLGLPALTGPNPAVQVSLGFLGYFDGFAMHSQWTLPSGAMGIDRVWCRVSGTGLNFYPMHARPDGLPPVMQVSTQRIYEYRQNALWMPGALEQTDLRIRCKITLPPILGPNIDFATTYVPVIDSFDAIVDRMLVRYARRFSPDQVAVADASSKESIFELQQETVRQAQRGETRRRDFGEEAVGNFAGWNSDL
jgi:hypothetical protein